MPLTASEYKPGLGKREASLIAGLAEAGKTIFSMADACAIIGSGAKDVVRRLVRKKWVLPLKRGLYAVVPLDVGVEGADAFVVHSFVIASMLVRPYYIGFWSALNHHGLTDQIPRTTFVATTKPRHPVRVLDAEYYFVKLAKQKFFGWQEEEVEGHRVRISNPEKTIADCLDHPEHCGGIEQIARAIYFSHEEIDMRRVVKYADRMANRTVLKRLGYILQATGLLERYRQLFDGFEPSAGYPKLDPLSPKKGRYDSRWRLLINFDIDPARWQY